MSNQITQAMVEGYHNNIYMLSQQQDARLFGKSSTATQNSKQDFHERMGSGDQEANDVVVRHGDTPINNTPHSRRAVTLYDADYGDLIDKFDKVRLLIQPQNGYVKQAVWTLNRKKDDRFIAAALGSAKTGENGEISVALPNSQKVVSVTENGVFSRLTVHTLTLVQAIFDNNDVDENETRYFALTGNQRQGLLRDPEAISVDYASVKALVEGKINYYMGFNFIRSQRLPVTTTAITVANFDTGEVTGGTDTVPVGSTRCFAWAETGMLSVEGVEGMGLNVNIAPDPTKKFSTRIYACHSVGAVRMEEEKVVEVICKA